MTAVLKVSISLRRCQPQKRNDFTPSSYATGRS